MLKPQNGGPYGLGAAVSGNGGDLVLMKRYLISYSFSNLSIIYQFVMNDMLPHGTVVAQ
jgi:hypothetical protein